MGCSACNPGQEKTMDIPSQQANFGDNPQAQEYIGSVVGPAKTGNFALAVSR